MYAGNEQKNVKGKKREKILNKNQQLKQQKTITQSCTNLGNNSRESLTYFEEEVLLLLWL